MLILPQLYIISPETVDEKEAGQMDGMAPSIAVSSEYYAKLALLRSHDGLSHTVLIEMALLRTPIAPIVHLLWHQLHPAGCIPAPFSNLAMFVIEFKGNLNVL